MRRAIYILTSVVVFGFAGCESADIVSLPEPDAALVVNCIGYHTLPWRGRVSSVQGVLHDAYFQSITNASVNIYENGTLIDHLVTADTIGIYTAFAGAPYGGLTSPKPGNTYKIVVEAPGYTSAESEYIQPDSIPIQSFTAKTLGLDTSQPTNYGQFTFSVYNVQLTIAFADPPGQTFYEVFATGAADTLNYGEGWNLLPEFIDPSYKQNSVVLENVLAFDDTFFDGKSVQLDFLTKVGTSPEGPFRGPERYRFYLRNISKEYYQYLKTTDLQRKANTDPFAQPVLIENNIKNGYGVFGGITESSAVIRAPKLQ